MFFLKYESIHRKNHKMHRRCKNKNIQIPHVNSNAFMTYWTVFKEIISYKSVSQL